MRPFVQELCKGVSQKKQGCEGKELGKALFVARSQFQLVSLGALGHETTE